MGFYCGVPTQGAHPLRGLDLLPLLKPHRPCLLPAPAPCCSRFLQGPGTSKQAVAALKEAIAEGREITVRLLNYSKDVSLLFTGALSAL